MNEERRLINIGMPIEDAIMVCFALRRAGGLEAFVRREEEKAKDRIREESECTA